MGVCYPGKLRHQLSCDGWRHERTSGCHGPDSPGEVRTFYRFEEGMGSFEEDELIGFDAVARGAFCYYLRRRWRAVSVSPPA